MEKLIDDYIHKYRDEIIHSTSELVKIPSIAAFCEHGFPYGKECANALDFCNDLCEKKGLLIKNFEYYCSEASLERKEEGKKILFAAHADVVPPDEECLYPPFGGVIADDYIIGRGVVDNKAPLIAVIYALAFYKINHIELKNRFSLLIGSNEESGMEDIDYYLSKCSPPDLAIAVDDDFPVVNSECGVMKFSFEASASKDIKNILSKKRQQRQTVDFCGFEDKDNGTHVFSDNTSAPIVDMLQYMRQNNILLFENTVFNESVMHLLDKNYSCCVFEIFHGTSVKITLTNIHMTNDHNVRICFKMTFTHEVDFEVLHQRLQMLFDKRNNGFKISHLSFPFFIDENNQIVRLLTDLYNNHSKTILKPYTMTGITYARKFPFGLGFGAGNPAEEKPFLKGHGMSHCPDEAHSIKTLLHAVKIYIYAIKQLDDYFSSHL